MDASQRMSSAINSLPAIDVDSTQAPTVDDTVDATKGERYEGSETTTSPSCGSSKGVKAETGIGFAETGPMTVSNDTLAPNPKLEPSMSIPITKKRRLQEPKREEQSSIDVLEGDVAVIPKTCLLPGLPFDILEEILRCTGDPGDLLAVARTCKAMCNILLGPSASRLWREARNKVGLPDPSAYEETYEGPKEYGPSARVVGVQCFIDKEAAYADFVFGEGVCEMCKKATRRMYQSFALRLRLCGNPNCRQEFRAKLTQLDDSFGPMPKTIPVLEASHAIDEDGTDKYWPRDAKMARENLAHKHFSDIPNVNLAVARNQVWMKFCVALHKWSVRWQAGARRIKSHNESQGIKFAEAEGWNYSDMLSTSYGQFFDITLRRREELQNQDFERLRSVIARELHELKEERDRKVMMRLRETNLKSVWKFYQKLMSQPEHYPCLPPFPVFLELPAIQLLQSSDLVTAKIDVKTAVRGKTFMKGMLKQEIDDWVEIAKRGLLESIGGSSEWNNMVPAHRMPHPVLRLNARWKCRICDDVEAKYEMDGCLDFAGVCRHQCKEKERKKRGKGTTAPAWNISNFIKDEQACSALTTCLEHLGEAAEALPDTRSKFHAKSWRCMSCTPPLFLRSQNIAGHSHRHPAPMQIEVVLRERVWLMKPRPNLPGLARWLAQGSKDAKEWVEMKNYGCQHCANVKKSEEEVAQDLEDQEAGASSDTSQPAETTLSAESCTEVENIEDASEDNTQDDNSAVVNTTKEKKEFENKFNFNGLRSHLSSKHKIYQVRDEDFLCYQRVAKFHGDDQFLALLDVLDGWE